MSNPINNLDILLASMQPMLNEGTYYFATLTNEHPLPLSAIVATMRETEGLSAIISEETALRYRLDTQFKAAWITLMVHSDLAAVGLTAAFATALSKNGISCNVIAGNYHDHIFVPYEQRHSAMRTLQSLQQAAEDKQRKK